MGFDSLAESTVEDVVTRDTVAHLIRAPTLSSDAFGFGFRVTPNETVKGLRVQDSAPHPQSYCIQVKRQNPKVFSRPSPSPFPPQHPKSPPKTLSPGLGSVVCELGSSFYGVWTLANLGFTLQGLRDFRSRSNYQR